MSFLQRELKLSFPGWLSALYVSLTSVPDFFLSSINHHVKLHLTCLLISSLLIVFSFLFDARLPKNRDLACLVNFWIFLLSVAAPCMGNNSRCLLSEWEFFCVCVVAVVSDSCDKLNWILGGLSFLEQLSLGYNSHAIQFTALL